MKVFRLLMYEGTEEALTKHLSQTFLTPTQAKEASGVTGVTIKEVFRGSQEEPKVEYVDHDFPNQTLKFLIRH